MSKCVLHASHTHTDLLAFMKCYNDAVLLMPGACYRALLMHAILHGRELCCAALVPCTSDGAMLMHLQTLQALQV